MIIYHDQTIIYSWVNLKRLWCLEEMIIFSIWIFVILIVNVINFVGQKHDEPLYISRIRDIEHLLILWC